MAKTCDGPPVLKLPTAQTLLAEVAATLVRPLLLPGVGPIIIFHALPPGR